MFENFISSMLRPRQVIIFALYAVTIGALISVYTGYAVWFFFRLRRTGELWRDYPLHDRSEPGALDTGLIRLSHA